MGLTNFPHGITSFGVPVVGGQGLMTQGDSWFVRPGTGSDSNSGKEPSRAFATLGQALSAATANQNDVIYLMAESNTASATSNVLSSTLTWNKDLVHLVGVGAPILVSQRSRISQLSTATGVDPLINITAAGCIFKNLQVFHGVADATSLVAVKVAGQRNYFENVHFAGVGNATMSVTGAASLKLDGGAENVFYNCVLGVDTIEQNGNTEGALWCAGAATRNAFIDCFFNMYISAAGQPTVTINDTTAIDRWLWFKRCLFMAKSTNKAVTQTEVFDIPAGISQGAVVLQDCVAFSDGGAVSWTAGLEGIVWNNQVAAAASAGGGIMTNK